MEQQGLESSGKVSRGEMRFAEKNPVATASGWRARISAILAAAWAGGRASRSCADLRGACSPDHRWLPRAPVLPQAVQETAARRIPTPNRSAMVTQLVGIDFSTPPFLEDVLMPRKNRFHAQNNLTIPRLRSFLDQLRRAPLEAGSA